jgi:hypothetical protein
LWNDEQMIRQVKFLRRIYKQCKRLIKFLAQHLIPHLQRLFGRDKYDKINCVRIVIKSRFIRFIRKQKRRNEKIQQSKRVGEERESGDSRRRATSSRRVDPFLDSWRRGGCPACHPWRRRLALLVWCWPELPEPLAKLQLPPRSHTRRPRTHRTTGGSQTATCNQSSHRFKPRASSPSSHLATVFTYLSTRSTLSLSLSLSFNRRCFSRFGASAVDLYFTPYTPPPAYSSFALNEQRT